MDSVGAYIKREREQRGFTVDEVSRLTKISARYLRALEAEDYQSLPAEPFVRGFLRSYAQCIGLNPQEVMLLYRQNRGTGESPEDAQLEKVNPLGKVGDRRVRKLVVAGSILAVCVIALVVIVTQVLEKRNFNQANQTEDLADGTKFGTPSSTPGPGEITGAGEGEGGESMPGASTGAAENNPTEKLAMLPLRSSPQAGGSGAQKQTLGASAEARGMPSQQYEKLALKVYALTGTWVEVVIDEHNREGLFLPRGDTRVWAAKDRILLTLGNIKGVEVELNGKRIAIPEIEGNVLRNYPITRASLP